MNPASMDVAAMIAGEGIAEMGANLFGGVEPPASEVKDCITIYDTGGNEQSDTLAIDNETIQLRARCVRYDSGYNLLSAIRRFLQSKSAIVVNETLYVGFWVIATVTHIGKDENDLHIWTLNFRVMREPKLSEIGNRQSMRG